MDTICQTDGPLVPMVRLVPMENDVIPMVLLVQNKFAFTPSRNALTTQNKFAFTPSENALIIIMNISRSISQPRKTSLLSNKLETR